MNSLLEMRPKTDIVVKWPIQFTGTGTVEIAVLDTGSEFQDFYKDTTSSEAFNVEVIDTGAYDPNTAHSHGFDCVSTGNA